MKGDGPSFYDLEGYYIHSQPSISISQFVIFMLDDIFPTPGVMRLWATLLNWASREGLSLEGFGQNGVRVLADSLVLFGKHFLVHVPKLLDSQTTKLPRLANLIPIEEMEFFLTLFMTPPKCSDD